MKVIWTKYLKKNSDVFKKEPESSLTTVLT